MKKIVLVVGCACVMGYGAYRSFFFVATTAPCVSQQQPMERVIEEAVRFELPPTNTFFSEGADRNAKRVFKKITEGNYEAAFRIVFEGLQEFPKNFDAQSLFASLLGDYSEHFSGALKERMSVRSKAIFEKLLCELDGQTKDEDIYIFLNEYNFHLKKYKDQYEHGQRTVARYWNTAKRKHLGVNGYYSQGVGAAQYAKQLLIEGQQRRAHEYAQKALVAWAQYFTYDHNYYNSYVHYALALGILGYKDEMMKALQRSADLIQKDLSYVEFKDVIDFVSGCKKS